MYVWTWRQRSGHCCLPCWSLFKYWICLGQTYDVLDDVTAQQRFRVRRGQRRGVCMQQLQRYTQRPKRIYRRSPTALIHSKSNHYSHVYVRLCWPTQGETTDGFLLWPSSPSVRRRRHHHRIVCMRWCIYVCVLCPVWDRVTNVGRATNDMMGALRKGISSSRAHI